MNHSLTFLGLLCFGGASAASVLPATPYLSFNDSPFASTQFEQFYLEDFEDGLFNAPGITGVSNRPGNTLIVVAPSNFTDSVDADDGLIDGFGRMGRSLAGSNNAITEPFGYTFTFDSQILGSLPTHVGLVWTDGGGGRTTQVEFFGLGGASLGVLSEFVGEVGFDGRTSEDRFLGAIFSQGIESFTIRTPGGVNNLEVDHLQYGIVPAPGSFAALISASVLLGGRRRRK